MKDTCGSDKNLGNVRGESISREEQRSFLHDNNLQEGT
jgi:hypothetical protein